MCRIAGIYNPKADNLELDIVKMRDAMHRGGPDDAGIFLHQQLPLAFGHRRLSILDLSSAGHQPMCTADERFVVSFNGEIYNFKEIRRDLEVMGQVFSTQTDTEVILHSYRRWGTNCFRRFNGMFAISIWDQTTQEIVLARDHAGIKPIYYYLNRDLLIFASEIRAFKALFRSWEPEPLWKPAFLLFGHLPEPFSTLKGVYTLEKGTCLRIHLPSLRTRKEVFYLDDYVAKVFNEEAALQFARDILPRAVKRHLISDAPIGLFLSGGIDSSLLTLLAAPILRGNLETLSIYFKEAAYSEEVFQKMVIDITQASHNSFSVGRIDFENALEDILEAMDQPSIDAINTYFISMYARRCGLKAVISGLGADELFGGYPSFRRFMQWKYLGLIPTFITEGTGNFSNSRLSKLSFGRFHPMLSLYLMNRALFTVEKAAEYTESSVKELTGILEKVSFPANLDYKSLNANSAMETNLYMKNQLLKDSDYMGMWHGVEIRTPFLDKDLMQAINSVDPEIKFKSRLPKSLLIRAFSTLLPAEIWHRKKQGFTFPFSDWLSQTEGLLPQNRTETKIFNKFRKGQVHWSRYWAIKLTALERFN